MTAKVLRFVTASAASHSQRSVHRFIGSVVRDWADRTPTRPAPNLAKTAKVQAMNASDEIERDRAKRERPRLTRRIALFETPRVVAELEERAADAGRSLSAEVRAALRAWIAP